jgi:type II secretory pathway component HofQ
MGKSKELGSALSDAICRREDLYLKALELASKFRDCNTEQQKTAHREQEAALNAELEVVEREIESIKKERLELKALQNS